MRLAEKLGREIESDLDWRQAELAVFRELLTLSNRSAITRRTLFRAGWSLLYAHYEGFSKYCLELYIEFVCRAHTDCQTLPDRMFVYLLEKEIRTAKSLSADDAYNFFRDSIPALRAKAPKPIGVDTKSNLWPDLLQQILQRLDLQKFDVIGDMRKIDTLVARRNDIAHGKKVFIDDLTYYQQYEDAVINVMYGLALAVVDRYSEMMRDAAE